MVQPDSLEGTHALLAQWMQLTGAEREAMSKTARNCFEKKFHVRETAESLLRLIDGSENKMNVSDATAVTS